MRYPDLNASSLIKVTGPGGESYHGGNGKWTKGRWRSVTGPLEPCANGLHVVTIRQSLGWLGPEMWLVELPDGVERIDEGDKSVVRKARVTERITTWDETTARLFACDCAEHVLGSFERRYPDDKRPREAIEVARRFARGEATDEERAAARAAAWAAARAAAGAAAGAAARAAAGAAAGAAAWAAAVAAAGAAAWAAETEWQVGRLLAYLRGEA